MKKKTALITLLVLILALGGWYFFFHKSVVQQPINLGGTPFGTAPDNIGGSSGGNGAGGGNNPSGANGSTTIPTLFKVSADPVAGAVVFLKNKQEMIRYVNRADGHIYEVDPLTLIKTEIVNNTAPKIYEADWKADGSAVILRTLKSDEDTIMNISLSLTPPNTKASSTDVLYHIAATELRGNLSDLAVTPTGLAYVLKDTGAVTTSGFNGEKPTNAYVSAFNEWQLVSAGPNTLALTTNASANLDGFAYLLNTSSRSLSKLLGPLLGLTTLANPDGSRVLYSYLNKGSVSFNIKNLQSKASSQILPTTLPEKCVWSLKTKSAVFCGAPVGGLSGSQPDDWYQGKTHFNDQLWEFDTNSGNTILLAEPKRSFGVELDVTKPSLSPNEDYLIFVNNTDLSLWALKL